MAQREYYIQQYNLYKKSEDYSKEIISGIYIIENIDNSVLYVGKSKDIYFRFWEHKRDLGKDKEYFNFQFDYYLYGIDSFKLSIIKTFPKNDDLLSNLAYYELKYIYEDFKDACLYNEPKNKDLAAYYSARFYFDLGYKIKFRDPIDKNIIDIRYLDEQNREIAIDILDPDDPRKEPDETMTWNQKTIANHKKICKDKGIHYQCFDAKEYFGYQNPNPEPVIFKCIIPDEELNKLGQIKEEI